MTDTRPPRLFRSRRLRRFARRTDIYNWLRTYHDLVAGLFERGQGDWNAVALDMSRDEIKGRDGAQPTANATLRIWQRVCRDVTEQQERPSPRCNPSRMPLDWRPPTVSAPAVVPLANTARLPAKSTVVAGRQSARDPSRPRTPEEQRNVDRANAQMDALFAEHDKKFRF